MAGQPDLGSVSRHVISGWLQSAEPVAPCSKLLTEQRPSTCKEDEGSAFVKQQQQQQQQSCDAGQQELGEHNPNYPTLLQHMAHEQPHTVRCLSNQPQNAASSSALLQPAVQATRGTPVFQGAAALQHNAVPLNSQPFLYRPLAQRAIKKQIQHPVQHERSTLAKLEQLQLSQQPVQKDAPADSLSSTGEEEGLLSVQTMLCYPPAESWLPPGSFVHLVGDVPMEQTVVDSQRKVAVTRVSPAMMAAKSARAKRPKKRLSTKRQLSCCFC